MRLSPGYRRSKAVTGGRARGGSIRHLKALAAGGIGWRWSLLDIGTGVLGVLVATGVLVEAVVMQALAQEAPLTVKEAARFLGVSPQTVYAWVERRQIPHLRVMGRNIRFL